MPALPRPAGPAARLRPVPLLRRATWSLLLAGAVLAGCASRPPSPWSTPLPGRDGPGADPPPGLAQVPDAQPRVEPIRAGGPNKPYEVLGERYVPVTSDRPMRETGLASWYGRKFHGRPTSNGETYDMYAMTAAHKTMPLPSYARVRNPANGREIVVRVNDRGPFAPGRVIDLSYTAALKLGLLGGVAPVEVERLTHDEIRAGAWRRGKDEPGGADDRVAPEPAVAQAPPAPTADDPLLALVASRGAGGVVAPASAAPVAGYWLQLGAFRQREGATLLQQRLQREADWLAPRVAVLDESTLWRVQAGPWATREEAQQAADRLRTLLALTPLLLDRR